MAQARVQHYLDLADWRRRVGDLYRLSGPDVLARFRHGRDELFRTHPQSPLSDQARTQFKGLRYFDQDPAYRLHMRVEPADAGDPLEIDTGGEDGVITYRRAGWLRFRLGGEDCRLTVFSLVGYGGGLFLPFRDATSGNETYGGGRYLFDTVKNTDGLVLDLAAASPEITIDFNFAYNPSCVYDARWACPLAPRENWLTLPVRAGEKMFP
jgi:uncharacterized protein (DUF1684 family)